MTIVGGFDVHRKQLTFDYVDTETGEVRWGQIRPATRKTLRSWLAEHCPNGNAEFALEGCTGWRYVAEELTAVGAVAHLADPAEAAGLRGAEETGQKRPHRCPAVAHTVMGGPVTGVGDPTAACAGGAHAGTAVLRVDGRTPRLAATHPRPAVPSGLPTD